MIKNKIWLFGALLASSLLIACSPDENVTPDTSSVTATAQADLVIMNGRVKTMDGTNPTAEAVAIRGATILKVGSNTAIQAVIGADTRTLDAKGATVLPGFNDSHVHFISGGHSLKQVDLAGLKTLSEVQNKIRNYASTQPKDSWLMGFGWLYDPFANGSPTKEQLDAVTGEQPALMYCYDYHSAWVNSAVLRLAGITKDTKDPVNGQIVRDPVTREPTGHLKESAMSLIDAVLPKFTDADNMAAIRAAVVEANRFGVTSIHNAGTSLEDMELFDRVYKSGDLKVRAYLAIEGDPDVTEADLDKLDAVREQYGDNPTMRTGIVKIFSDGVIESQTAAMLAPFEGSDSAGEPLMTPEQLNRMVAMYDKRGWQVMIHAIGDRAIRMTLDAFEKATAENPVPAGGRRHRIEHIEAIAAEDIARFGELGVIASMQPMHAVLGEVNQAVPKGLWPDAIGSERASRAWPWKSIQEAGGHLTFGSDWIVASIEAAQGIWLASNRIHAEQAADQRLSIDETLAIYTKGGAYASFDDTRKGTLSPGMLADIVVLTTDIDASPITNPGDMVVAATIFDGKVVYEK
jgi:predicted amidohydrolase YtcJ